MPTIELTLQASTSRKVRSKLLTLVTLSEQQMAQVLHAAMAFALQEVHSDHKELGALANTFMAVPLGPFAAKVVSPGLAAKAVDYQRRAGQPMPPAKVMANWAQAHGLAGLEFVIARAIAKRGIKGRFYGRRVRARLHDQEIPRYVAEVKRVFGTFWSG